MFQRLNYYIAMTVCFLYQDAYARSARNVARRVGRDVKDFSIELLFIGILIVGALFALGSRNASEKAVGWLKGVFLIFGGSTLIALVKGWF